MKEPWAAAVCGGQSVLFSAFYQGKKGKLCYICKLKDSGNM